MVMTEERFIEIEGTINLFELRKVMFDATDATDEATDRTVSMKLLDDESNVLMLIEALSLDFSESDAKKYEKGCLIKRFEFVERLINSSAWADFIMSFVTSVRYAMIPCGDCDYQCRYTYIWVQKHKDEPCVIAKVLGLDDTVDIEETRTFIGKLPK
jgi:hypothetical protein